MQTVSLASLLSLGLYATTAQAGVDYVVRRPVGGKPHANNHRYAD